MTQTLQRLFRFKAWADDALLDRLAALDRDSRIVTLATQALSHTYIVDRIFAAHLRRRPHAYVAANAATPPSFELLAADLRRSDREYVEYVATLDRWRLDERIEFRFTDGAAGCMSREEMLMHVVTHGVGHRGQVGALLLLESMPVAKDGFTTFLHDTEAATRGRELARSA